MEIILLENILNLGKIGEKVIVKNGYGPLHILFYKKFFTLFTSRIDNSVIPQSLLIVVSLTFIKSPMIKNN